MIAVRSVPTSWALALAGVTLALGLVGGWWIRGSGSERIVEVPAAAIQLSSATVLERQQQRVPAAILTAAKEVKGAKLVRAAEISLQPKQPNCEPLKLELGTVRMSDGTQRLIARSDQATITGGVDIPIGASTERAPLWAAGALYDPVRARYGAFVDRDLGRLRLGVDVMQDDREGLTAVARVGIRF